MYAADGTTVLATFGTIDVSTLTTSFAKYTFSGANAVMPEDGRIVVRYDNGTNDASNLLNIEGTTSDVYDSTNTIRARYTAGAWNDVSTHDVKFEIGYFA